MDCICLLLPDTDFMQLDKLVKIALIASSCLIATQLSACLDSSQFKKENGYLVDTAEITENSDRFMGKSVSVRNDVARLIGTRGLVLDKDRIFDGEPILVIDTSRVPFELQGFQTPEILVDGIVEKFSLDSVRQKYGLNLDSNLYSQYEAKPVIIAKSIILSPDPEDLTANPETYYDRLLAIKGEVDDVEDYGIFELDEEKAFGGEDLLVLQTKSEIQLQEEQNVIVYGVLRQFIPEELERDYDLDWDLVKTQIEAEHNGKPILVTEKIQLLD